MKKLIALLLISAFVKAQTTSPDSARYFEGSLKTVCGTVSGTHVATSGTIFLNFEKPFPKNEFTAVIFAKDTINFKEYKPNQYLTDKNICVMGTVKLYNGKPEIIIKSPNQIRFPEK